MLGEQDDVTTTRPTEALKQVSAGYYYSMLLTEDGRVWTTGVNEYGQLGDGTTKDRLTFAMVMISGQCDTIM